MIEVLEDMNNEFKIKLTEKLESEVIAFLNTYGGNIYIGVDDFGNVVGLDGDLDKLQRNIKDRIKDNIMPSTIGLFEVYIPQYEEKKYLHIKVLEGSEKPYYLKGKGMSPDGCFMRVGSSIQSMPVNIIDNMYEKRNKSTLRNIESPKQDLTFEQLKIYYQESGFKINENFLKQLNLYTKDGKFNYVAYLLADNNGVSIRFGKYSGKTAKNLIENEDYGCCSLIKATQNIINKFEIENKTFTKINYPKREEIQLFDFDAVREAVINAMCHNDWSREYSPKFEIFSDRLVISSNGGIQAGVTEEEFLKGFSLPKNMELMKVFRDIKLVEQMGTGIIRILESYDKSVFEFFPNFIRVSFPFRENSFNKKDELTLNIKNYDMLNAIQKDILNLIRDNPKIIQDEMAEKLGTNVRTIQRNFKDLLKYNIIKRTGSNKNGRWKIMYCKYNDKSK